MFFLGVLRDDVVELMIHVDQVRAECPVQAVQFTGRALTLRIELTDTFNFLVEQVNAKRGRRPGRIQVDHGSAHGKLPVLVDLVRGFIPGLQQALAKCGDGQLLPGRQVEGPAQHEWPGWQPLQQGRGGCDDNAPVKTGYAGQGSEAL